MMEETVAEEQEPVSPTDERLRQLADAKAGNKAFMERLRTEGVQVQSLLNIRLETLIDLILEQSDRIDFELVYEARVTDGLRKVETQARYAKTRASLLSPAEPKTAQRLIAPR
jgi:hypothetical protein